MATVNAVGNSLSGSTGSGTFVGATSPTLVTPTLGVASATSINFGVSALNYYSDSTSFTPAVTAATPGDLSMSYTVQSGYYARIGNVVTFYMRVQGTPTYTTASGAVYFTGLPFTISGSYGTPIFAATNQTSFTYPAGSMLVGEGVTSDTKIALYAAGSATATTQVNITNFTSGTGNVGIEFSGFYFV